MNDVRRDIADAADRMHVTFGTRAAIRNLEDVLEDGEVVREMVSATYAAGDGLLVLTDRRVLAIRDDYSMYRVQHVDLAEAYAVDYAPKIHDGLGVLTPERRVAVRKMDRRDSDRFVDALVTANPHIVIGASRPRTRSVPADGPRPAPSAAPSAASSTTSAPSAAVAAAGYSMPPLPAPPEPSAQPAPGASETRPATSALAQVTAQADADKEVLVAVLADLHAKGVLSTDELAAKIAQVTAETQG